jgi:hypothetical protein
MTPQHGAIKIAGRGRLSYMLRYCRSLRQKLSIRLSLK